jgi:hypothetical protein
MKVRRFGKRPETLRQTRGVPTQRGRASFRLKALSNQAGLAGKPHSVRCISLMLKELCVNYARGAVDAMKMELTNNSTLSILSTS